MRISDDRVQHWRRDHTEVAQGDSPPIPFDGEVYNEFRMWHVLELGPGEGRQFRKVAPICASYSIADIVPEVLQLPIYNNVAGKFLITDYTSDNFGKMFDVIHFWYVLHHVLEWELRDFFLFCFRHLCKYGTLVFNTPSLMCPPEVYLGDGKQTTKHTPEKIVEVLHSICPTLRITISGVSCNKSWSHGYTFIVKWE